MKNKPSVYPFFILLFIFLFAFSCDTVITRVEWPKITRETKPWTRWWWMGSAVNKTDLTVAMQEYQKAGLGGLEITPIYGVMGYEEQFINLLSPEWMEMLSFTLEEAERLDLGIDLATGSGWPFGGPWIDAEFACKNVQHKIYHLKEGESLDEPILFVQEPLVRSVRNQVYQLYGDILRDKGEVVQGSVDSPLLKVDARPLNINDIKEPISANNNLQALALEQVRFEKELALQVLMAYSNAGEIVNLTDKVDENEHLNWTAPAGNWTLYAIFQGWHGKMVERAGPGGEGNVIDHFSSDALRQHLSQFDKAFTDSNIGSLRAFFNDSYEVDDAHGQADWTPLFFDEFKNRRGYDLRDVLPALFGQDSPDNNIRVLSDFRETISDLLLDEFTEPWQKWAQSQNAIIRNQAHGSPANILDLYAASDIPETEGTDLLRIKFASSAAHVMGKRLTSSESATWLDEHFKSTLADVKNNLDRYFLGGVNHVFYHGTTYSPQKEDWPGWIFYASVHFGPTNSFWDDFSALNHYVTRCQSFLQAGQPDNDALLYFPFYDRIAVPGRELLEHFSGGGPWGGSNFRTIAQQLVDLGYSIDFISDKQIQNLMCKNGLLSSNGIEYKTIILPECRFMPIETLTKLVDLAKNGATIIFQNKLPADVPGFANLTDRREAFNDLKSQIDFNADNVNFEQALVNDGMILKSKDVNETLSHIGVEREIMTDLNLHFIRRQDAGSTIYFIKNYGESTIDDWVPISREAKSIAIFNPINDVLGEAKTRQSDNQNQVYLQLAPGESCILKTYSTTIEAAPYAYLEKIAGVEELDGSWTVHFIKGGPELPQEFETTTLESWTDQTDEKYKNFSGTAEYSISFPKPAGNTAEWLLDLGIVKESAHVQLNGHDLGTLFASPFHIYVSDEMLGDNNTLVVRVSNLMGNRIAYLDRHNVFWKKFYNINFPSRRAENRDEDGLFTAAHWSPQDSGLLGPVNIIPMKLKTIEQKHK